MTTPDESTALVESLETPELPAVVETSASAVAARERAAVEARFTVALHRPRNFDQARQAILAACRRPLFAAKVLYAKPIGGRKVHGLSIRFAEEAARAWGNLDVAAVVVFDDQERRIYRVYATDLETNSSQHQDVVVEKFVERKLIRAGDEVLGSRTNIQGDTVYKKVATEDEVMVKANAAMSKAKRNVILMLIPSDICEEAETVSVETVRNQDAEDPEAARKQIVDAFYKLGVSADQVKSIVGKPLDQLNPGDLNLLRQVHSGLAQGEVTWAEIEEDENLNRLREQHATEPKKKKTKGPAGLKDALTGSAKPEGLAKEVSQMELTPEQQDEKRIEAEEAAAAKK